MARVTIEDCLEVVENRFELVHLASRRTRQLLAGQSALVLAPKNKPSTVALREIAAEKVHKVVEETSRSRTPRAISRRRRRRS